MQSRSGTNNQPDYSAAWTEHVGHALIEEVTISIGGQEIDKHYGLWLEIWNDLTQTAEKEYGYDKMIGEAKREELGLWKGKFDMPWDWRKNVKKK